MDDLEQKLDDVIKALKVKYAEGQIVTASRIELEKRELSLSDRMKKSQDKELALNQLATDLASQRKFIEEQTHRNEKLLEGIKKERETLTVTGKERDDYTRNNEYLKIRESALEEKTLQLQRDKALFRKQEEATKEYQGLLEAREKRIKAREEYLDNIDKQTQL